MTIGEDKKILIIISTFSVIVFVLISLFSCARLFRTFLIMLRFYLTFLWGLFLGALIVTWNKTNWQDNLYSLRSFTDL